MWPDYNRPWISNAKTQFGLEIACCSFQYARVGKAGTKMWVQKTVPVAFRKSGVVTDTASVAITAPRLFGLDAGDWSMILLGLALSALLLVLA